MVFNFNHRRTLSILMALVMMFSLVFNLPLRVFAESDELTVTICEPADGSANVPVDNSIRLGFNQAIQPGDDWNSIALRIGDALVETNCEIKGQNLLIKPISNLLNNTTYTVKIPVGAIKNADGKLLLEPYVSAFSTVVQPIAEPEPNEPMDQASPDKKELASYDSATPPPGLDLKAVQSQPALQVKKELATTDVLLIQSVVPWKSNANEQVLSRLGLGYEMVDINQAASMDFSGYQLIMIANDQNNTFYNGLAGIKSKLENYAVGGGSLLYGACDNGWAGGPHQGTLPGGVALSGADYQTNNYVSDPNHPITTGEASDGIPLTNSDLYSNYASHGNFDISTLPPDSRVILNSGNANQPTLIEYGIGSGTVIASTLTWEHNYVYHTGGDSYGTFSRKAFDDLILYAYSAGNSYLTPEEYCLIYDPETREISYALEPIDTGTGAHMLQKELMQINGPNPVSFEISYNSLMLAEGVLGKGWGHNFEARLEPQDDGSIMLHWSANRRNLFKLEADNTYKCSNQACLLDELVKNADGTYLFTRRDHSTYQFDSSGKLTVQANKHKQALNMSYDGSNHLTSISESISGRTLSLRYNGDVLASVSDGVHQITFSYDNEHNLTVINNPGGENSVFTYDQTGRVKSETDAEGRQVFRNTYDEQGRVISQADGKNQISILAYSQDDQSDRSVTTVTDRNGSTRSFTHNRCYEMIAITDELGKTSSYSYDANGNRISITNAAGQVTRMAYDDRGNLASMIDPAGNTASFSYDSRDNLISVQNPAGKRNQNAYDENNNLVSITDLMNNTVTFSYDANGLMLSRTSPGGKTTSYTYENSLLKTVTDPSGITSHLSYDSAGRLISVTNAAGKTSTLTYDEADNIITTTDPLGQINHFSFDLSGNLVNKTDPCGNQTSFTYDANNNLLIKTDAQNNQTSYEYDGEDRLVKTIDSRGNATTLQRDAKGRGIGVTDPLGNSITMQYDDLDNLTAITDALGHQIESTVYDNCSNPVSITDALGNTSTNQFDNLNRLVKQINPLGQTTAYNYDDLGRLSSVTDALGGQGTQLFDADGNLSETTDPNANRTGFTYDAAGRITSMANAIGTLGYSYNEIGLLMEVINGRGQKTTYQYDDAGRLHSFTDPEGSVIYTYDANGNLLTTTDNTGTITREYDSLNRLVTYTDARGNTIHYGYDQVGNLTSLTYPDSKVVSYEYDPSDRLSKVADWAGRVTTYEYDANGLLIATHRPDGSLETRSYDAAGQPVQIKDMARNGSLINQYDFSYDAAGNIIGEQITPEPLPYMTDDASLGYTTGNRLQNANGQGITYDADGNMLAGPLNGKKTSFAFDSRNRLANAGSATYSYDAENNRIGVTINGASTTYVIDPNAALGEVLVRTAPDGGKTYYVYGLGLTGQEDETGYKAYHYDLRGSTVALTDESGAISDTFQYDTYGALVNRTGTTDTPFRFCGMSGVMSDANGLYYMRARYYSPEIRQFINQDVLLGGLESLQSMNRYAYCGGDPIQMIDPSGYMSCSQTDNLLLGIGASVSDSVKDLLNTFKKDSLLAIGELAKAVWNNQLSVKDLAAAMGQSIIKPYGYAKNNFDDIFRADPSDREVFEYGRNVGQILQDIAGVVGGAAACKALTKACPKLMKLFKKMDEASFGDNTIGAAQYIPKNINKVSDAYLKKKGINAHQVKSDVVGKKNYAQYDIYLDKDTGELWVFKKGGKGEGIPTGISIR